MLRRLLLVIPIATPIADLPGSSKKMKEFMNPE